MRKLALTTLAGLLFAAAPALADAPTGNRANERLDRRGERVEHRLDARGDRIAAAETRSSPTESPPEGGPCSGSKNRFMSPAHEPPSGGSSFE